MERVKFLIDIYTLASICFLTFGLPGRTDGVIFALMGLLEFIYIFV